MNHNAFVHGAPVISLATVFLKRDVVEAFQKIVHALKRTVEMRSRSGANSCSCLEAGDGHEITFVFMHQLSKARNNR
jgi:hypothetical protein